MTHHRLLAPYRPIYILGLILNQGLYNNLFRTFKFLRLPVPHLVGPLVPLFRTTGGFAHAFLKHNSKHCCNI